MGKTNYQILRVLAVLIALTVGTLLCFILLWLIGAHGVIACGRGIFNNPDWPIDVVVLIGTPSILFIGSIALIRHCSKRLWLR